MDNSPQPGWQDGRWLETRSYDGRHCVLSAPKVWQHPDGRRFMLPENATTDGASVPDALASLGFTSWGAWWMAAVLHDCAYRNSLLVWDAVKWTWSTANLAFDDCNEVFKIAMQIDRVAPETVEIYYEAVKRFGLSSYQPHHN